MLLNILERINLWFWFLCICIMYHIKQTSYTVFWHAQWTRSTVVQRWALYTHSHIRIGALFAHNNELIVMLALNVEFVQVFWRPCMYCLFRKPASRTLALARKWEQVNWTVRAAHMCSRLHFEPEPSGLRFSFLFISQLASSIPEI